MKKLTILVISALFMVACTSNHSNNATSPQENILSDAEVDISNLQLGSLEIADSAISFGSTDDVVRTSAKVISLKNSSASSIPLHISPPNATAGFSIKVNRCGAQIAAKSSCLVTIEFSNRGLFTSAPTDNLIVYSTDPQSSLSIPMTAQVTNKPNPNTLEPSLSYTMTPAFGASSGGTRVLSIKNAGPGDANALSLSLPSSYGVWVSRCPTTLKAGYSCEITILYKDIRNSAPVAGDISINFSSPLAPSSSKSVNLISGATNSGGGGSPPSSPNTVPLLTNQEKLVNTISTDISVSVTVDSGTLYTSGQYSPNTVGSVSINCDNGATGYISVYLGNDGIEAANSNPIVLAADNCGSGQTQYINSSFFPPYSISRNMFNEPLYIYITQYNDIGDFVGERVQKVDSTYISNTPPKLATSSSVTFVTDEENKTFVQAGFFNIESGYEVPELYNLFQWSNCQSASINGAQLYCGFDVQSQSFSTEIPYLFIKDEQNILACGQQGDMILTLCDGYLGHCQPSTIHYVAPSCM